MPPPRVTWTPGALAYFNKLHLPDATRVATAVFNMTEKGAGDVAKIPGTPRGFYLRTPLFVVCFEVDAEGAEILILDLHRAR